MTGDRRLRRVCLFDAITNNADRKGTHLLPVESGHVYGVDHGICFSRDAKLRTVLWAWRGTKIDAEEMAVVDARRARHSTKNWGRSCASCSASARWRRPVATRAGADRLVLFPEPDPTRPAVPWPPF